MTKVIAAIFVLGLILYYLPIVALLLGLALLALFTWLVVMVVKRIRARRKTGERSAPDPPNT